MEKYQVLWEDVKNDLELIYDEQTYNEVFSKLTNVHKFQNGYIYIIVELEFEKNRINRIYLDKINSCIAKHTTEKVAFKFVTKDEIKNDIKINEPEKDLGLKYRTGNLQKTYSFQNFVVGNSNRFAFNMAMRVADQPGIIANPLYIFGNVGLGKTHLMHAIGNYILDGDINKKILYIKADQFIEDYSYCSRKDKMDEFNAKYRDLDALLIDDIQLLGQAKKTQGEFFKIFDILFQGNKQIVITSDRPAKELKDIVERLTSRFEMGLTVDVLEPDLNQRIDILKKKILTEVPADFNFPEEVLDFIATYFKSNIRELEGALKRVFYYCVTNDFDITIEHAEEALDSLLKSKRETDALNENNYDKIQSVVAAYYSISVNDLIGKNRGIKYTTPRHIAMYLIKKMYDVPYKKIGAIFGNRDHSTIISACEKIEYDIKNDSQLKNVIDIIKNKVQKD